MKVIKHTIIAASAVGGVLLMSSAGFFASKKAELSQIIIENNTAKDALPVQPNTAFKEGEVLTYLLHYGVMDAGVAVLEVKPSIMEVAARKVYHIVGNGYSKGTFDWFFKVRDTYETFIDKETMLPLKFIRNVDEGGYKIYNNVTFKHTEGKATSTHGTFNVPNCIQDVLSAIYFGRNIDFSKLISRA